jgi:hypothetical protein
MDDLLVGQRGLGPLLADLRRSGADASILERASGPLALLTSNIREGERRRRFVMNDAPRTNFLAPGTKCLVLSLGNPPG